MTGLVSGARHHDVTDRAFLRLVLGVFALVALLRYLPILTGKVPFPADIVNTIRHGSLLPSVAAGGTTRNLATLLR